MAPSGKAGATSNCSSIRGGIYRRCRLIHGQCPCRFTRGWPLDWTGMPASRPSAATLSRTTAGNGPIWPPASHPMAEELEIRAELVERSYASKHIPRDHYERVHVAGSGQRPNIVAVHAWVHVLVGLVSRSNAAGTEETSWSRRPPLHGLQGFRPSAS
jgi:hypothetical protein